MPKEKSPGKPTTRRYTDREKAERCGWCASCARSWAPITGRCSGSPDQLGYGVESVRTWVTERRHRRWGRRPGRRRVRELETEIKELEQEMRELRRANEILRKAAAYFAQAELDRPSK